MSDLVRRAEATRRTLERYRARPFDWKNRATCAHLARAHLRHMGHRPPRVPDFRSPIGARRALKAAGFGTLEALLDSLLERIAPAAMLVGDVAIAEGDDGAFDSILVCAGSKMLGWHADDPSGIRPLILSELKAAWRV